MANLYQHLASRLPRNPSFPVANRLIDCSLNATCKNNPHLGVLQSPKLVVSVWLPHQPQNPWYPASQNSPQRRIYQTPVSFVMPAKGTPITTACRTAAEAEKRRIKQIEVCLCRGKGNQKEDRGIVSAGGVGGGVSQSPKSTDLGNLALATPVPCLCCKVSKHYWKKGFSFRRCCLAHI